MKDRPSHRQPSARGPGTAIVRSAALSIVLVGACSADANREDANLKDTALDICKYELAFADEFDDLSLGHRELNGKRWTVHTPWDGDFGDAMFSDPRPNGRPFAIKDGKLHISAFREDGRWRSGLLAAADASGAGYGVRYGYFEARMRMPPGPGTWPAFWLISLQKVATRKPRVEIDVIEYYGHRTDRYWVNWHVWPNSGKSRSGGSKIPVADKSLVEAFHTYGVRIEPKKMTYYFDRQPIWQTPTPKELKTPLYPLVNLALGSGYSIEDTPDPSVLEVDYVRVYRPRSKGALPECDQGAE